MDNRGHEHSHDAHGHNHISAHDNKLRFILVIIFNLIITIVEYIGGIISGSLALISDAGHNLSDVMSLVLGYTGERVSEKKSANYTFGLKRFEVFVAFINALTLIGIGVYIFYEAVIRFQNPSAVNLSIMLPVAVIGLLGNIFSIFVLQGVKGSNLNIRAAFLHLVYDALSSAGVIIAGIVIYFTSFYWADIIISFIIGIMIIWSSLGILKESFRIFLQGVPDHIDPSQIYSNITDLQGVASIHGLHIWSINSKEVFLSCHVCLDQDNKNNSDELIKKINMMLEKEFNIDHTTLQVESGDFCGGHGSCCS
jgi:cobalt-zinc-cadmium efflux system protein